MLEIAQRLVNLLFEPDRVDAPSLDSEHIATWLLAKDIPELVSQCGDVGLHGVPGTTRSILPVDRLDDSIETHRPPRLGDQQGEDGPLLRSPDREDGAVVAHLYRSEDEEIHPLGRRYRSECPTRVRDDEGHVGKIRPTLQKYFKEPV